MRRIVSNAGAFVAAGLTAAIAPGRSAEARTCDVPEPERLFLELESVSINGFEIIGVEGEVWAHPIARRVPGRVHRRGLEVASAAGASAVASASPLPSGGIPRACRGPAV
ncbi:MAG TPA: hypothetical protein VN033_06435 [Vulgatibacter sp.]|nr:hypothetical protein [Vulgatibacter sp.]